MAVETYVKQDGIETVSNRILLEAKARAGEGGTDLVPVNQPSTEVSEHLRMLVELNMHAQADWHREGAMSEWGCTTLYPELKGAELRNWRLFLPMTYRKLAEYNYDVIPVEAVSAIHQADTFAVFDRIEIWTDQGNTTRGILARGLATKTDEVTEMAKNIRERMRALDPMAVGVLIGHDGMERYFQIVRWGADKLLTPRQVARHNASMVRRGHVVVAAPLVAIFLLVAFMLSSHNAMPGLTIPVVSVLAILALGTAIVWHAGYQEYLEVLEPRVVKRKAKGATPAAVYVAGKLQESD